MCCCWEDGIKMGLGGVATKKHNLVAEHLSTKYQALGSIPNSKVLGVETESSGYKHTTELLLLPLPPWLSCRGLDSTC